MKKSSLKSFLLILTVSIFFLSCTTDPIPGPAGADGEDGIDGVSGTAECAACHNVANDEIVQASYLFSGHAAGGAVGYAGNRSNCAQCHSHEGYVDYIEYGMTNEDGYGGEATAISCKTCHSKHTSYDFENDPFDYALRNMEGVELIIGVGTIDYEGTSNNCLSCHQPRRTPPVDDGNGMFNVTPHYGPHYGAQSTMLEGIQGAEIAGSEPYPGAASSTHRQGASCVSCHMGEPENNDGEHSWIPTLKACQQCHTNATDFDINGVQTEITALMTELQGLLQTEGILDAEGELVTGLYPMDVANAYWNWEFTYQDHSKGIHNPAYNLALLKNSIELLNAQ